MNSTYVVLRKPRRVALFEMRQLSQDVDVASQSVQPQKASELVTHDSVTLTWLAHSVRHGCGGGDVPFCRGRRTASGERKALTRGIVESTIVQNILSYVEAKRGKRT
jgi:hypothetical protein